MNPSDVLDREYSSIINKKIVSIRPLTEKEMKEFYWDQSSGDIPFAIILDDGQVLIPASDPECNGPGYVIVADLVPVSK